MDKIQHISSFKLTNFKQFKSLALDNIGQFNLIVGDNNVGKTSLLEALLVHYDPTFGFGVWEESGMTWRERDFSAKADSATFN
ncbi:MAG: AAA family ATPase [Bacteroidia bacterium]|nr:AAA family ATPase [Bacteroidia bacterium]